MIPKPRKTSGSVSKKSRPQLRVNLVKENCPPDAGYSSSEYSPMQSNKPRGEDLSLMPDQRDGITSGTPLLGKSEDRSEVQENAFKGSCAPLGYVVLDHSDQSSDYYNLSSVGSVWAG